MTSIAIAADSAGAPLKDHLAKYMEDNGYEIKDCGSGTEQDYPGVAAEVVAAASSRPGGVVSGVHGRTVAARAAA
jgi:ribose 5-phosphate isomerase RpiB